MAVVGRAREKNSEWLTLDPGDRIVGTKSKPRARLTAFLTHAARVVRALDSSIIHSLRCFRVDETLNAQ